MKLIKKLLKRKSPAICVNCRAWHRSVHYPFFGRCDLDSHREYHWALTECDLSR